MGFGTSFIVFEIFAFKLKIPQNRHFCPFQKNKKIQQLIVRKLKKIYKNPYLCLLKTISKVCCSILSQKRSKHQVEMAFALGHFSKRFVMLREHFGISRNFLLKIFHSFIKGFQNLYGYGGLKLQSKKRQGGYPILKQQKIQRF